MAAELLERWTAIEPVLDGALDQAPERRSAFIALACAGDPALSSDLERLLRAGEAAGDFLQDAVADAAPLAASLAEHQDPAPGQWLGAYLVEREIGRGGMAVVYLAHDPKHQRRVALKVLRPELSGVLGAERFAREIAIAARLNHPHILRLLDSGMLPLDLGSPVLYYVMPYVAGCSLRERLRAEPQLPVAEAVTLARRVGEALDYAHRQGVIHRDIKPENILLPGYSPSEGGTAGGCEAVVADFGIARALDVAGGDRLTQTGLALGTPAYMSPEQATGGRGVDGRSDVYALGCVLYEMLAGQPPFTGLTAQAILSRHAVDPVPNLRTVRPAVPPAVASIVVRALAKVPADRHPTARAFVEALGSADLTEAPAAHRAPDRSRRRRALAAAGLATAVGVAVALVLAAHTKSERPVRIDPATVAVAPFRVRAADSSLAYLREGMVDLLAARLGGTLALRPTDSRTLLSAWRRAGSKDLSAAEEAGVARRLGAGLLVTGDVAGAGGRLSLSAALVGLPGGQVQAKAAVEGSLDSVVPLADQLAVKLLILGAGEPEERLASLARTPLPALRLYLDGQAIWRGGTTTDLALKKFEQALAIDSTFALAALWTVRSLFEGGDINAGEPDARTAWKLRDRLPPADRAYLSLFLGDSFPAWLSIRDRLKALEAFTRREPRRADGWDMYGGMLASNGVLLGVPDANQRAKSAFARALARNPASMGSLWGYIQIAADLGDSAGMRSALARFRAVDSVSPLSAGLQWRVAVALGDTATARRVLFSDSLISPHADASSGGAVWMLATTLGAQGVGLRDLDVLLRRSLAVSPTGDQRDRLRETQFYLEIMRGRGTGLAQPGWTEGPWPNVERVLDALFADGDPAPAVAAAATLEREVGRPLTDDCCIQRFAAAQSALAGARIGVARRVLADLRAYRPRGPDSAAATRGSLGYAAIVAAQLALLERSPLADERLRQLDSMLTNPPSTWGFVMLYGNLIAARLHEARGELGPALAATRRCDWTSFWPVLVAYHREEGRLAALAGDTAGAIRAYRRYLGIRADPDARVRPQVQQVRAALGALEHGGRAGP